MRIVAMHDDGRCEEVTRGVQLVFRLAMQQRLELDPLDAREVARLGAELHRTGRERIPAETLDRWQREETTRREADRERIETWQSSHVHDAQHGWRHWGRGS